MLSVNLIENEHLILNAKQNAKLRRVFISISDIQIIQRILVGSSTLI